MTQFTIGPQDQGRKREFEHDGVKFIFEFTDPYGMIRAYSPTKKATLDGLFTTMKDAETAAIKYVNTHKKVN